MRGKKKQNQFVRRAARRGTQPWLSSLHSGRRPVSHSRGPRHRSGAGRPERAQEPPAHRRARLSARGHVGEQQPAEAAAAPGARAARETLQLEDMKKKRKKKRKQKKKTPGAQTPRRSECVSRAKTASPDWTDAWLAHHRCACIIIALWAHRDRLSIHQNAIYVHIR
jgi:hypothetical protein